MDALTAGDVALCCSHVNSYPLDSLGGVCPLEALGGLIPERALRLLGIMRVEARKVTLKPSLVPHAVEQ